MTSAVVGQVIDGARIVADGKVIPARLVIMDRPSPVLARGALRPGMAIDIPQDGAPGIRVAPTGEAPALVLPWPWIVLVAAAFPLLVTVVVRAESAVRRRLRLADVLRVGG